MLAAFIIDIMLVLLILYLEKNQVKEWYNMALANIMFCVGVLATLFIME